LLIKSARFVNIKKFEILHKEADRYVMDKKVKFIGFRATNALAEAAKRKAKSQHRSLAGYLRYLVERDILTLEDRKP
jgi:hypothetical protein